MIMDDQPDINYQRPRPQFQVGERVLHRKNVFSGSHRTYARVVKLESPLLRVRWEYDNREEWIHQSEFERAQNQ